MLLDLGVVWVIIWVCAHRRVINHAPSVSAAYIRGASNVERAALLLRVLVCVGAGRGRCVSSREREKTRNAVGAVHGRDAARDVFRALLALSLYSLFLRKQDLTSSRPAAQRLLALALLPHQVIDGSGCERSRVRVRACACVCVCAFIQAAAACGIRTFVQAFRLNDSFPKLRQRISEERIRHCSGGKLLRPVSVEVPRLTLAKPFSRQCK